MRKKAIMKKEEEKKTIQKQRGGINQEVIDEWHDIDKKYEQASLRYRSGWVWSWIIRHKVFSLITTIILIVAAIFSIIYYSRELTQPTSHTYFKNDKLERVDDQTYETFSIVIGNDGTALSKNVIFEAEFSNRVTIDLSKCSWSRDPDNVTTDSTYWVHYIKLRWNEIPSPLEIPISLHLDIVGSPPESGKVVPPVSILVYVDGEQNPIYNFERDTLPDIINKIG